MWVLVIYLRSIRHRWHYWEILYFQSHWAIHFFSHLFSHSPSFPSWKKGKSGTLLHEFISNSSHFYPCSLYTSPADITTFLKYTKNMLSSWPLHLLSSQQNILVIVSCLQSFQFSRKGHMCIVKGNICCLFWDSPKAELELIICVYSERDLRNISWKVGK